MNWYEAALAFLLGATAVWIVWVVDEVKKAGRRSRDIPPEDVPDVVPADEEERF